ncbi:MAG: SDR family NAD(P)-dependent oxidoreductase [Gaiellales bacterium]
MAETALPGPRGTQVTLDGAVAIVTGASAGIGAATARALRLRGSRVIVAARRAEPLQALAEELDGLAVVCDVGDYGQVHALVQRAVAWGGRLDVMVNNAGVGAFGLLHELDPSQTAAMVRTNVLGVIYGMRAAAEVMVRQRSGGIVNVSSIVGEFPDPGSGAYAASKAAVDLLSRTAYRELRDLGVHVVNIKPALTDTEFSASARDDPGRRVGGDPPEKVARWICEALESGSTIAGYR